MRFRLKDFLQLKTILFKLRLNEVKIKGGNGLGSQEEVVLVLTAKANGELAPTHTEALFRLNSAVEYTGQIYRFLVHLRKQLQFF